MLSIIINKNFSAEGIARNSLWNKKIQNKKTFQWLLTKTAMTQTGKT